MLLDTTLRTASHACRVGATTVLVGERKLDHAPIMQHVRPRADRDR